MKSLQQRAIKRIEETGNALHIEDVDKLIRDTRLAGGPKGLIGQLHQRCLIGRRLQHAVEFRLLASFRGSLEFGGAALKDAG
ncbi:MAG TPA: hypothetical protein VD994_19030, partial [Prosthecobacter sp.]|nr:hypothetical protein [Prosthecobacter sp.]